MTLLLSGKKAGPSCVTLRVERQVNGIYRSIYGPNQVSSAVGGERRLKGGKP